MPILGAKVAYDFRSADVRAGGQGAPLAAAYHAALLREADASGDTAVLNLGGVGNITWWDGKDNVVAFDTGPANAPLNDFIKANGLGEMDRDGALGARRHGRRSAAGQAAAASIPDQALPEIARPFRLRRCHG